MTRTRNVADIIKQPFTTTLGTSNYRAGVNAGNSIASGGNYNVVVGDEAGTAITTGLKNVAVGMDAMGTNVDGDGNVAVGYQALKTMEPANGFSFNTAVGAQAGLSVTTGVRNTLIGGGAGDALTDADFSVAIGDFALSSDTLGSKSVAIGSRALVTQNFTTATDTFNTAVGFDGAVSLTTGIQNTIIGGLAGGAVNTGSNNVLIGFEAGDAMTTGHENICIGFGPRISAVGGNNQIVMGEAVVGNANSSFVFGTGASDSAIGNGSTTITAPSDQRYKEEIADATAGLSFIKDLRPVTFKWKKEKDLPTSHRAYVEGSEKRTMNDYTNHGFIAQEVKTAIDAHSEIKDGFDMWCTDDQADGGRQRLGDASLMPLMVKAVQEQNALIVALTARVATLEG